MTTIILRDIGAATPPEPFRLDAARYACASNAVAWGQARLQLCSTDEVTWSNGDRTTCSYLLLRCSSLECPLELR